MKVNAKHLSSSLAVNLGPLAPILIAAAIASAWFAASSVKSAASSIKSANESTARVVRLDKTPITSEVALAAAKRLTKLSPSTTVAVSGKFVVVSIAKPELFAEWMHALTEVQSVTKGAQWEVEEMCISSCEGGEAAKAYLTAYTPALKVQ